ARSNTSCGARSRIRDARRSRWPNRELEDHERDPARNRDLSRGALDAGLAPRPGPRVGAAAPLRASLGAARRRGEAGVHLVARRVPPRLQRTDARRRMALRAPVLLEQHVGPPRERGRARDPRSVALLRAREPPAPPRRRARVAARELALPPVPNPDR